ncbi:hypothetical protein F5876DRAFT_63814 [Lentinula aff. lateritia]|uniref:Uncharacterized protein n=1 Tax=Lentinula aff. lateritia TaxID=2804960 RepID=A0ACC1U780_9AGAR|nr:hypothetical protein F5876DRAFT_63814 [Lentinula aff. lateritia]
MYHMAIQKFKSRGWTNSVPPVGINHAGLRKPYLDLAETIPPRSVSDLLPKPSMNPFKNFFYIDEAYTLTASNGLPSPFIHLRSALSRLHSLSFAVAELAEHEEIYSASAVSPFKSIPLFTEMPFDLMSGSNGKPKLSALCPTEVDSVCLLSQFGRPLYSSTFSSELETAMSTHNESAATDIAARRLFNLIEKKLTSQKVGEDLFNLFNELYTTASSSNLARQKPHHLEMIRHHMRTVYTMSKNRQIIRSGYPSEPILSSTALSVVRRIDHKYTCDNLAEILSKSDSILAPDPRQRGEQVAMIILLRAYAATVEEMSSTFATGQTMPLLKFLKHLLKTEFHSIYVESRPDNHLEGETFEQAFKDYTVRFNHFVRAENSSVMTAEAAFVMYLHCAAVLGSAHNKEFDIGNTPATASLLMDYQSTAMSLLQVTDFFADHPREQTIKEVYAMKPFWTAGSSFGFVDMNKSFLTAGIDDEYRVDGVHAQMDTSDDEFYEDETDEDEASEDETGEGQRLNEVGK